MMKQDNLISIIAVSTDENEEVEEQKPAFVYFIKVQGQDIFKIGMSNDPRRRLASMQSGCPLSLHLYATILCEDSKAKEKTIHEEFEGCKIHGEWYEISSSSIDAMLDKFEKIERWMQSERKWLTIWESLICSLGFHQWCEWESETENVYFPVKGYEATVQKRRCARCGAIGARNLHA